jgi:hypothetical protein
MECKLATVYLPDLCLWQNLAQIQLSEWLQPGKVILDSWTGEPEAPEV